MDPSASVKAIVSAALPYAIGVALPIAAVVWPIQYGQGQTIQKLADQVSQMDGSVAKLVEQIASLDKHWMQAESDPDKLVAKVIGIPAESLRIATMSFVGDDIVVFPRTDRDKDLLVKSGFELKQVSPTIWGYVPTSRRGLTTGTP